MKRILGFLLLLIPFLQIQAQCRIWTTYSTGEKNKCVFLFDSVRIYSTYPDGMKNKSVWIIDGNDIWSTFPEGNKKDLKYVLKGNEIWSKGSIRYLIDGQKVFDMYPDGTKAGQLYILKGNIIYSTYSDGVEKEPLYMIENSCRSFNLIIIAISNHLNIKNIGF